MVHGYHAIFAAYGFWLPNDPRGSWSAFVASWELVRFGRATKSLERVQLTENDERRRAEAKRALRHPPLSFSGQQARAVGRGFATAVRKSRLTIWACSVLPEHVHLVLARHTYKVEQMVNLLKGSGTSQLRREGLGPTSCQAGRKKDRTPWGRGCWREYLDSEESIENAIHYVEQNPVKEGKPRQNWSFVSPFRGLEHGWITYH